MFPADVVVLGPQRRERTVGQAVREVTGLEPAQSHYAVVTAGWQERESEDEELVDHLGGHTTNLKLFERAEDVFKRDPEWLEAMLAHNARLKKLQALYRIRLAHSLDAARTLLGRSRPDDDAALLEIERSQAIDDVRRLDAQQLERLREMNAEFRALWKPHERESIAMHRAEIRSILANTTALCIAGGHVLILLNRLRMFGLMSLAQDLPILCWSAGAMALSDRIVVFHDSPPQGPGNAEILEAGIGLFEGLVPLPHANHRLRLEDPVRVGLFARRFGPSICAVLIEGTRVDWDGQNWKAAAGTKRLNIDGSVEEINA